MIKLLLVDDDTSRYDEIKSVCKECFGVTDFSFDFIDSVLGASDKLIHEYYDLVVIDLNLPHRKDERPKRDAGLTLLRRIVEGNKFIVPNHIVGITSYDDIREEFISGFDYHAVTIVQYSITSEKWKSQIKSKLNQILYTKTRRATESKAEVALITVHGIRTFGEWQKRLKDLVLALNPNINVFTYKYGYFSIVSYLVPYLRTLAYKRFLQELKKHISVSNGQPIDIVAHSFGTFLVANAIANLSKDEASIIRNVIFAGSVLPANFAWRTIIGDGTITRVINECATKDFALVFNGLFLPFVGVAGITGFTGMTGNSFTNRFFNGHHSYCFLKNGQPYDDFMLQYWLPILVGNEVPCDFDERQSPSVSHGVWLAFINNIRLFKAAVHLLMVVVVAYLIYSFILN